MVSLKTACYTFAIVVLLCIGIPIRINGPDKLIDEFDAFLDRFNKTYENETLYEQRFGAFKDSLAAIDRLNSRRRLNSSAVYGLTQFSDLTTDEFLNRHLKLLLSRRPKPNKSRPIRFDHLKVPKKVDWRSKGVVTEVKTQGDCGACWAFCVAQDLESMRAIKTGKLANLSVQQLIDCAGYKNKGCKGGNTCSLLKWMRDFQVKVETEDEYPLTLRNQTCKTNNSTNGLQVKDFACQRLVNHEDLILQALAQFGPVSVAIDALTWQNYLGGVIQFHCDGSTASLNHAVQIVGYDLDTEIPHYIVRNTWGKAFGDGGYLYVAIGENVCGIANEVAILTVK